MPSLGQGDPAAGACGTSWVRRLALALGVAALVASLSFLEPVRLLEGRFYDIASTLAPLRPPEPGAVVVAIDEPSFQEIGQRWPWPRDLHARLVESLRAAGARVIALDIIFAEPSAPEGDGALAAAVGPEVLLAADEAVTAFGQGTQISRIGPLPELIERGAREGLTAVDPDGDAVLRRLPTVADGFAQEALRLAGVPTQPPPEGALIQYFGPPRTYPTISYYQALDPARFLPPDYLKGRIVLVGLSLRSAAQVGSTADDAFVTPYTLRHRTMTSGVEVQATILDNLRLGLYAVPAGPVTSLVLVVIAAAWIGLAGGPRVSWRTGLTGVLLTLGCLAGSWAMLRFGRIWVPPVSAVAATLSVLGIRFLLDFVKERRLRRAVSEAFAQYLAPELVERLARDPSSLRLGGERRTLSVLFCDIRGFTTLSERLKDDPERLTALVNRILDPLTEAVLTEGGTIDKYIGDCVMAFWNAPLPAVDHAVRSVMAARRMIDAAEVLSRELAAEAGDGGTLHLAVGVGVNTGDCLVGNVGSRWRFAYSALGDPVNVAARLEGLCKDYGVPLILGEKTAEAVRHAFVLLELDRVAVRGRSTEASIHTVLAPASSRDDPAVAALVRAHESAIAALRAGDLVTAKPILDQARSLAGAIAPALIEFYVRAWARALTTAAGSTRPNNEQSAA